MPQGVVTTVIDGYATIDFVDKTRKGVFLSKLLEVGGPETVQILTREGPRRLYRVPEGNARAAGLIDEPATASNGEVEQPRKRGRPRKTEPQPQVAPAAQTTGEGTSVGFYQPTHMNHFKDAGA